MSEENKSPEYDLARKKVEAIIGFRIHLIAYLAVNALLLIINLACFSRTAQLPGGEVVNLPFIAYFWVIWPLWGWGLGVAIHYVVVREFMRTTIASWKARKIAASPKPADEPRQ